MDHAARPPDPDDADYVAEPRPRVLWRLAARVGTAIAVGLAVVVERRSGRRGRLRD